MSSNNRYIPSWPFPESAYIPGVNPHPHLHLEAQKSEESDLFKYALDLFNYQYYWESHVYFEALWNMNQRKGSMAEFCKAMIKLGAAGVKLKQKEEVIAIVHLKRAKELFQDLEKFEGSSFQKFELTKIIRNIDSALGSDLKLFQVHPIPHTD